ncbi:MAG: DegV family protein [Clostridiales bacterium]|nr:DegV family protein [Clostridiales bacterium]
MKKIAVVTDTNSGITQEEARELGVKLVPMPFIINDEICFEGIELTQEKFYEIQSSGTKISTSQPNINEIVELWEKLLKEYDEIVYIPMSSGLSKSCETAQGFANQFDGKVQVVDNKRVSITMKGSVVDAVNMVKDGKSAKQIKEYLEETALHSSIYLVVDTLKYLKQGGRVTPAAAAIATVLNIKPILQIQGGKLDTYAKVMNIKSAKMKMVEAIKKDIEGRFKAFANSGKICLAIAHSNNQNNAILFAEEIKKEFPNIELRYVDPLALSIATHTGPKVLALACFRTY